LRTIFIPFGQRLDSFAKKMSAKPKRKRDKQEQTGSGCTKRSRLLNGSKAPRTKFEIIATDGPESALQTFLRNEPQTDQDLWSTAHLENVPDAKRVLLLKHITDRTGLDGSELLVDAAYRGFKETARTIIEMFEFDINYQNDDRNTALCAAARMNDDNDIASMLLEQPGIDINIQGVNQRSAVWFAACNKNKELLDRLVELGAETLEPDAEDTLPEQRTTDELADTIRNNQDVGIGGLTLSA
jgi:ankyrin repeat protein